MKYVLPDTNTWVLAASGPLRLFDEVERVIDDEYRVVTPESVLHELETLRDDNIHGANLALSIIEHKGLKTIQSFSKYADGDIERLTTQNPYGWVVITNDSTLVKTLRDNEVTVYTPRQRNHLEKSK